MTHRTYVSTRIPVLDIIYMHLSVYFMCILKFFGTGNLFHHPVRH